METCIYRVGDLIFVGIQFGTHRYNLASVTVHVADGWRGVHADGVELVRLFHDDACEGLEVFVVEGGRQLIDMFLR